MTNSSFRVGFLIILLLGLNPDGNAGGNNDAEALKVLFHDYIAAWNNKDFEKIASEIYRTPVYIFEGEVTNAFLVPEDISTLLRGLRVNLDASGFSHSELRHVSVCDLGGDLAFATFHYSRFIKDDAASGDEVLSSAYIARNTDDGWRLVAHVIQQTPGDINCTEVGAHD